MRAVGLTVREDRHGSIGLFVNGVSNHDEVDADLDGISVAHDLIEHVHGLQAIGDVQDELYALGGIWAVRGQFGVLREGPSIYSPEENLAADVSRMAIEVAHGTYFPCDSVPRTHRHYFDDAFEATLSFARRSYRDESEHYDAEYLDHDALRRYWEWVIPAMRLGARAIKRRFGDYIAANAIYWNIVRATANLSREYEGQRYKLSWNRHSAIAVEDYDDE